MFRLSIITDIFWAIVGFFHVFLLSMLADDTASKPKGALNRPFNRGKGSGGGGGGGADGGNGGGKADPRGRGYNKINGMSRLCPPGQPPVGGG